MTYLLDANTLAFALNDTGNVRARLNDAETQGRVLTSAVVVAELAFGASASGRPEKNHVRLKAMLARLEVVPFGEVSRVTKCALTKHEAAPGLSKRALNKCKANETP